MLTNLNKNNPFNRDISSKKLNTDLNFQFERGWSAVLAPIKILDRVVFQLVNWVGGEGEKPLSLITPLYLGSTGYVTNPINAVNIADGYISSAYLTKIIDSTTMVFSKVATIGATGVQYSLQLAYNNLDGSFDTIVEELFSTDSTLTNYPDLGITRSALQTLLDNLKDYVVVDDVTMLGNYIDRAPSQHSVIEYIKNLHTLINTPIMDLTTSIIHTVEGLGASLTNPYYILVGNDLRTSGRHTTPCTVPGGCGCDENEGYEEMGNTIGITGCLCDQGVPEVNAECLVTILTTGAAGDTFIVTVNGKVLMHYSMLLGDTTTDIAAGLAASINSSCGGASDECIIVYTGGNTITIIAADGLGSLPNAYVKSISNTGTGTGTITQTIMGVDYIPATYRGVSKHLIAFDGTTWRDFGNAMANTTTTTITNTGIKYHLELIDNVTVAPYYQYIVHDYFIVDGTFTLDVNAELVIL